MEPSAARVAGARRRWTVLAVVAVVLGCLLTTFDFLWAFLVAPMQGGASLSGGQVAVIGGSAVSTRLLFSQKIFYFHVPVAIASFGFVIAAAVYGALFLARGREEHDMRSRVAMQVGLFFIVATMVSGDLWTRHDWGVWWVWEPRLTTYFILTLLVIAYFILRSAVDDPERRARFAAVFSIVAAVDAPISFFITRLVPSSIHPVVVSAGGGLPPAMLAPFIAGIFGMALLGFGVFRLRVVLEEQSLEVESLKRRLEGLRR